MVNDRFSAYNQLLLDLQQQLFEQWHRDNDGTICWAALQLRCRDIWLAFAPRSSWSWSGAVSTAW
jgi:hypothetical protein